MLAPSDLEPADYEIFTDGAHNFIATVFTAEAHGVQIRYRTIDPKIDLWVSPIFTMRQKGVALVDRNGNMVANERRDR